MADRYWVGVDSNWHDANNWASTSGGAGGAGVPTSVDDVYIDGNGYILCWPVAPFECNNMTLVSTMTEMLLINQGGIIYGDFLQDEGYFGPTGGGGYIIEFKGNWTKNDGTFAVGTGSGRDPEVDFSGTGKTYTLDSLSGASYQHLTISGSYTFSGTRLSIAQVYQEFNVPGTLSIASGNRIDLDGTFPVHAGTIEGQGRIFFNYDSTSSMPAGGTIKCRYFTLYIQDPVVVLTPRTYESPCDVEVEFNADGQTFRVGAGRHYFHKLTILGDDAAIITAEFDCDTETGEMWVNNKFNIDSDAFPNATFTIKFGDGLHIFRGTVDFYFNYFSANTHLVVDAGDGTIVLWPMGRQLIPFP